MSILRTGERNNPNGLVDFFFFEGKYLTIDFMLLRALLEGEGKHAQMRSDQYSRERIIGTVD